MVGGCRGGLCGERRGAASTAMDLPQDTAEPLGEAGGASGKRF